MGNIASQLAGSREKGRVVSVRLRWRSVNFLSSSGGGNRRISMATMCVRARRDGTGASISNGAAECHERLLGDYPERELCLYGALPDRIRLSVGYYASNVIFHCRWLFFKDGEKRITELMDRD